VSIVACIFMLTSLAMLADLTSEVVDVFFLRSEFFPVWFLLLRIRGMSKLAVTSNSWPFITIIAEVAILFSKVLRLDDL